jgi:RNA polymerase sigma-70 factor (ECF subfamily)
MLPSVEISTIAGDDARSPGNGSKFSDPMDLRGLFECYYASVWRLLRRLGVPQAQLDDAAQEVFWVAARRIKDIEPGRAHPFLYGVALRIASTQARRHSTPDSLPIESFPHLVDQCPSPEERYQQQQLRELLDVVLSHMSAELRTVFILCEIEELEVRQVAGLIEIPVGTASSRLRRAREEFSAIAKRVRVALQTRGGVL